MIRAEASAISLEVGNQKITLVSAYNPPSNIETEDIDKLLAMSNSMIIAGDLNAKHGNWNCRVTNNNGQKLINYYYNTQQNFEIIAPWETTHYPDTGATPDILDIALVKNLTFQIEIKVLNNLSSDHLPVELKFSGKLKMAETRTVWLYKFAHWEQFRNDVDKNLPSCKLETSQEIDSGVETLTRVIQEAMKLNIPKRKIREHKPQLPERIKSLFRQRNEARKKWQRNHTNLSHKREMNRLREEIRNEIKNHESEKWDSTLENLDPRNMKEIWDISKRVKYVHTPLPPLTYNNQTATTAKEKVNTFAETLSQTFTPGPIIDNKFNKQTEDMVTAFIKEKQKTKIRPSSVPEVIWQIRHLKDRKSPGPDEIQNLVLKNLPNSALKSLTNIINAIFKLQYFPKPWKTGNILLFPKHGKDLHHPENYRPITLLNTMSKVAEKIINKRLRYNLKQLDIIRNEQFGFRPHHDTTAQLMRHVVHITRGFNENRATVGLYLDIKQAFDKVWHNGLIRKLIEYQIDDAMILILINYLHERHFVVKYQNETSNKTKINSGVPQGSILAPTLFITYINDIPHSHQNNNSTIHIFADDTLITSQSIDPELAAQRVQENITLLEDWLSKWRIQINTNKCQAIMYSRKTSILSNLPPKLTIKGEQIDWTPQVKYLGVTLDNKLHFKPHITNALGKAHGQLKRLYPLLNEKSKLHNRVQITMYKTLLRPILTYASPIWAQAAKRHINKLQVFQNRILYNATKIPRYTPVNILHHHAEIDTIEDFILTTSCKFHIKCEGHENPLVASLCHYNTSNNKYKQPKQILPQALQDDLT